MAAVHDHLLSENDAHMIEQDAQMAKVDAALAERETVEEPFTPKCRPRPTKTEVTEKENPPLTDSEPTAEIPRPVFGNAKEDLLDKPLTPKEIVECAQKHLAEDVPSGLRKVSSENRLGTTGYDPNTGTIQKVAEITKPDGTKDIGLKWVSDCAVRISVETSATDKTEFTFRGVGAKDGRTVCFTMRATDMPDEKKFTGALYNAFGAKNLPGALNFAMVQTMTIAPKFVRRVEVPEWVGNVPMIPGLDLAKDVEFRLSQMTPSRVYDGDLQAAKEVLRKLLKVHPNAPILVTAVLGAPLMARWRPDDRIALALWGGTGSQKTTVAKAAMTVYGADYESNRFLLKAGKGGSTPVAAMDIMARAGFLPQIYDDVKAVDPKDHERYVSLVHAVVEGADKQRGKKDGGTRDALTFYCSPIITGEVRPEEASTDARVLNIDWPKATDTTLLSEVQRDVKLMPVIGYHWLNYLAQFLAEMADSTLDDLFTDKRNEYERKFDLEGHINAGRLATIYAVLRFTWNILMESSLAEVFTESKDAFINRLDDAIWVQGAIVNGDTEVSKFLAGVSELLASQPMMFQDSNVTGSYTKIIGKRTDEGLFLLPSETLAELEKIQMFTQRPTADSMTKALYAAGKLIPDTDGKHLMARKSVNGHQLRGWLLKPQEDKTTETRQDHPKNPGGLGKNGVLRAQQPTKTTKTTEKAKTFFPGEKVDGSKPEKSNGKSSGLGGLSGLDEVIDNDFDKTTGKTTPRPLIRKTPESTMVTREDCSGCGIPFAPPVECFKAGVEPESDLELVRVAALMEYGINGVVVPGVLSARLSISLDPIMEMLLELGYEKHKRQDGTYFFKQPSYTLKEAKS